MVKIKVDKEFLIISEMMCFFRFESTGEHKEILLLNNEKVSKNIKNIHKYKYFECLKLFVSFVMRDIPKRDYINLEDFCHEVIKDKHESARKHLTSCGFKNSTITDAMNIAWLFCMQMNNKESRAVEIFSQHK